MGTKLYSTPTSKLEREYVKMQVKNVLFDFGDTRKGIPSMQSRHMFVTSSEELDTERHLGFPLELQESL
ncbi:MAG: hypothetical protein ABSD73_08770 [Candidatus Bathyarchaeia archaeon]